MSHTTLHLRRPRRADHAVLEVAGELDLAYAGELRDKLAEASTPGGHVVVDLGRVEFLDSTALGVLVAAAKRLHGTGGELVVRSPRPHIRRVFELTGLDRVLALAS